MLINLSVNVTYRCNAVCAHCDRGIGAIDWRDVPDMRVKDAMRVIQAVRRSGHKVRKVKLIGGEPTLNKDLVEIAEVFLRICDYLWVVTNRIHPRLPELPPRAKYKCDPLDDKEHFPFFVSPTDVGLGARVRRENRCIAPILCGRGVDPGGEFMQCSVARVVARGLGLDDRMVMHKGPVTDLDPRICQHCPLSLGTIGNKKLTWRVHRGEVECPTKSFVNVKREYKITHAADWHIRQAVAAGRCTIDPATGFIVDCDPAGRQLHGIDLCA
jgi:hypothetical protein